MVCDYLAARLSPLRQEWDSNLGRLIIHVNVRRT